MVRHIQQHIGISNIPNEENCGRNTINDLFKRTRTNRRKASNAVYMIMLNANKDYPENKQRFLLNKKKEPLVRPTPPSVSRADPEQCCWGGCELDGAKRRRASATEAARSACRGSCGRGLGAQK